MSGKKGALAPDEGLLEELSVILRECGKGGPDAPRAFHHLLEFLLSRSVMKRGERLFFSPAKEPGHWVIGGRSVSQVRPVKLNNNKYLAVWLDIALGPNGKIVVHDVKFQYQADEDPRPVNSWYFRYEYRPDKGEDPHLQVNAEMKDRRVAPKALPEIHLPSDRISLEQIVRMLVKDCKVEPNAEETWEALFEKSQEWFQVERRYEGL